MAAASPVAAGLQPADRTGCKTVPTGTRCGPAHASHPAETRNPREASHRSPPARAGGTAGDLTSSSRFASQVPGRRETYSARPCQRTFGAGRSPGRLEARQRYRPAVPVPAKSRGSVVCERGLGRLVVNVRRQSGAGWPNGPPSPRLAPGGFYGKRDWLRAKRGAYTLFQLEDALESAFARGEPMPVKPRVCNLRKSPWPQVWNLRNGQAASLPPQRQVRAG